MSTRTGVSTSAFTRAELLSQQINLIVQATTGSSSFKQVIKTGIEKRWIDSVFVTALTPENLIVQRIEIKIDWQYHLASSSNPTLRIVHVNLNGPERDWLSRSIGAIIDGFNEVTALKGLKTEWTIYHTPEANARREEVKRELGLVDAESRKWVPGTVDTIDGPYAPQKLKELQISWKAVTEA